MTGPEGNSEFCFPRISSHQVICNTAKQIGQTGGKQIITLLTNDVQQRSTFAGHSEMFPVWRHSFRNVARSWHFAETVSLLDVMWPWTSQWMGAQQREKRQLYNNGFFLLLSFKLKIRGRGRGGGIAEHPVSDHRKCQTSVVAYDRWSLTRV